MLERRLARAHAWFDAHERALVGLHAQGLELDQRPRRGAGQARLLPDPGGQAQDGELGGGEGDLGQRVGITVDAVADLVLEPGGVAAGDQRDAELAQLLLVALEHAVEGLRRLPRGVLGHGGADLLLAQPPPGGQEGDHEVQESLGALRGHCRRTLPEYRAQAWIPSSGGATVSWSRSGAGGPGRWSWSSRWQASRRCARWHIRPWWESPSSATACC